MKRIQQNNPNTQDYWTDIYRREKYDLGVDFTKHLMIATQIIDGTYVVDYGCGPGEILQEVAKIRPHCALVGVDHAPYPHSKIKIIQGSVYEPITRMAQYVISTEVIEHLDDPQKAVDCLYTSLLPEGTAFLTTPYQDHIPSSEHIWEYKLDDMNKLFEKFTHVYVFPLASGRCATFTDGRVYPPGNVDTILVRAIK